MIKTGSFPYSILHLKGRSIYTQVDATRSDMINKVTRLLVDGTNFKVEHEPKGIVITVYRGDYLE